MSEQESPKTDSDQTQTESQDNKETTSTEVEESESSEESLLSGKGSEDGEKEEKEKEKEKEAESKEEEVQYELSLPEDALISEDSIEEIKAFAKENKLSNESAQKLIDRENKVVQDWVGLQQESFAKTRDEWIAQAKNDKEFGRSNFKQSCQAAKDLVLECGGQDFFDFLERTGYSGNYMFWRFCNVIQKLREGDRITTAEAAASAKEIPLEQKMYSSMYK